MAEYIEREALLKDIENDSMTVLFDKTSAIHHIKKQPAADVAEVRHGKWDNNCNCSVCGVYKFEGLDADIWANWDINYCPNCGAKMDLGDDEE